MTLWFDPLRSQIKDQCSDEEAGRSIRRISDSAYLEAVLQRLSVRPPDQPYLPGGRHVLAKVSDLGDGVDRLYITMGILIDIRIIGIGINIGIIGIILGIVISIGIIGIIMSGGASALLTGRGLVVTLPVAGQLATLPDTVFTTTWGRTVRPL